MQVIEVHGSIRTASCLACGHREPFERVVELLPVPGCAKCGEVLKPDVVMFGELLPEGAMERATELALGAGLVLVVGSSLEVYPVAGLADLAGRLAIVNMGQTPFDGQAELTIDAPAGETLAEVVAAFGVDDEMRGVKAVFSRGRARSGARHAARDRVGAGSAEGLRAGVLHRVGTGTAAFAAVVRGKTEAYRHPAGRTLATFPKLNENGYPTTFSIVGAVLDGRARRRGTA